MKRQMITRRELLGGLGAVAASCASEAAIVKGSLGAFGSAFLKKPSGKVWTWKEMFFNLAMDTWSKKVVMPEEVNKIGRSYWWMSGSANDICFLASTMTWSMNAVGYQSGLTTVRCPYISTIGYVDPIMNSAVKKYYIPNLKDFSDRNNCFYNATRPIDVYINESTCAEIMSFRNFPGCNSRPSGVTFHGKDGTITYDGSSWNITAGIEEPYPYDQDEVPVFVDDTADLYWKDLFFKVTEDGWDTSVTFPAEVNRTGRPSWLHSSKLEEVTLLCDSFAFANNPICYGCAKCQTVNMPNLIEYGYPGPTMNGYCTALHIPKCKKFTSNIALGTKQARLDVYIDESSCAAIMAFQNFPSCTGTMRNNVFFHGSDGMISFDVTNWVIT